MIICSSATCAGDGFSSHQLYSANAYFTCSHVVVTPVLCTGLVFYMCHGNKLILKKNIILLTVVYGLNSV